MGSVHGFPASNPADALIGARIKRWRDKRGIDQDDLARILHLSSADMRLIEAGRRHMDSAQIDAATRALRLPIWALMTDTPSY
ncbi:helix-turn-helix transcriptional regulator [Brevundimonas sp. BH3]|uniref:helix-turn-helix domain-containing protein n=1 Tax=unclassified Brevundimonas TaxID=2622653 RepID=UPI00289F5D92|nr:helix-turn-helix transcriptional regulator [Brevundimonas sp.]